MFKARARISGAGHSCASRSIDASRGRALGLTVGDVEDAWIDRFFVVVVVVDGVLVEMRADERVVAEHFVVHRVLVVSVDVERVRRFLITDLIDALVHLAFHATPFGWTEILDSGEDCKISEGEREREMELT